MSAHFTLTYAATVGEHTGKQWNNLSKFQLNIYDKREREKNIKEMLNCEQSLYFLRRYRRAVVFISLTNNPRWLLHGWSEEAADTSDYLLRGRFLTFFVSSEQTRA